MDFATNSNDTKKRTSRVNAQRFQLLCTINGPGQKPHTLDFKDIRFIEASVGGVCFTAGDGRSEDVDQTGLIDRAQNCDVTDLGIQFTGKVGTFWLTKGKSKDWPGAQIWTNHDGGLEPVFTGLMRRLGAGFTDVPGHRVR